MRESRYTAVAIVLHWTIAAALVGNFVIGLWMSDAIDAADTQARAITAFQLHKSLGLTVLLLSLVRLAWRWVSPPPALPSAMPAWEKFAARLTHWAFYVLMLVLPLSGWLYVSTQWRDHGPLNVPTLWFGLFEVPHLFGLSELARESRQSAAELLQEAHQFLAWGMGALFVLHVGAALKHHFINRDDVLTRMGPLAGAVLSLLVLVPMAWLFASGPATSVVGQSVVTSSPESNWSVNPASSDVTFSGTYAGVPFRGRFTRWQADIRFNPADLAHSQVGGAFETASASDGAALHDESMPQTEWFNAEHYPTASFRSTRITPRGEGTYNVDGALTIKGHALPVTLTLNIASESMNIGGVFEVDRHDADLGMESDAEAQYVSRKITVVVRVEARRLVAHR